MRYTLFLLLSFLIGCEPTQPLNPFSEALLKPIQATHTSSLTFAQAKKVLPEVYAGHEVDIYCGCQYAGKTIDLESCGYIVRKNPKRASRLEWEHVVPAWVIGHQRQCWQDGGRRNCTANDPVFAAAEGDLVNLTPSVGEVNGDRGNFAYSQWRNTQPPMYGQCQTVVDFKARKIQPREESRGELARITLYVYEQYQLHLSRQDRQLMCAWAKKYPVSDWEIERNRRIIDIQGFGNPLINEPMQITRYCKV